MVTQLSLDSMIQPVKGYRDYVWEHRGLIFYLCNEGFGIRKDGATICLGEYQDIEGYLQNGITGKLLLGQIEVIDEVKTLECEIVGENENKADRVIPAGKRGHQPGARKGSNIRKRSMLDNRRRPAGTRRSAGKRFPVRLH